MYWLNFLLSTIILIISKFIYDTSLLCFIVESNQIFCEGNGRTIIMLNIKMLLQRKILAQNQTFTTKN